MNNVPHVSRVGIYRYRRFKLIEKIQKEWTLQTGWMGRDGMRQTGHNGKRWTDGTGCERTGLVGARWDGQTGRDGTRRTGRTDGRDKTERNGWSAQDGGRD